MPIALLLCKIIKFAERWKLRPQIPVALQRLRAITPDPKLLEVLFWLSA